MRMFTTLATRVLAAAVPVVVGLGTLVASPAGATVPIGPSGAGWAQGTSGCYRANHSINVSYAVQIGALDVSGSLAIAPQWQQYPEWVEVYAYVKSSASTNWGTPVAHTAPTLVQSQTTYGTTVLNTTRYGAAGATWDTGFYVRFAYPGGAWTQWIWDPAVNPSTTAPPTILQGITFQSHPVYGYCQT